MNGNFITRGTGRFSFSLDDDIESVALIILWCVSCFNIFFEIGANLSHIVSPLTAFAQITDSLNR